MCGFTPPLTGIAWGSDGGRAGFGRQALRGQVGVGARTAPALSFEALSPVGD